MDSEIQNVGGVIAPIDPWLVTELDILEVETALYEMEVEFQTAEAAAAAAASAAEAAAMIAVAVYAFVATVLVSLAAMAASAGAPVTVEDAIQQLRQRNKNRTLLCVRQIIGIIEEAIEENSEMQEFRALQSKVDEARTKRSFKSRA